MLRAELTSLYNGARSRCMTRREQALSSARSQIYRPGNCRYSVACEQIRAWFDIWEQHLWDTYNEAQRAGNTLKKFLPRR